MAGKRRGPPRDAKGRFIKRDKTSTLEKPKASKAKAKAKPKKRKPQNFERAPRPYKDAGPIRVRERTPKEVRKAMVETLEEVARRLGETERPLDAEVTWVKNRDGSIDAQLFIMGREDVEIGEVYERLGEMMPDSMGEVWVSHGIRFDIDDPEDRYLRFKGLSQVQSNYQQYTDEKGASNLITGRLIAGNVEERHGIRPASYFVRLFWSPEGDQPGGRGEQRSDKSAWGRDRTRYNKIMASARKGGGR